MGWRWRRCGWRDPVEHGLVRRQGRQALLSVLAQLTPLIFCQPVHIFRVLWDLLQQQHGSPSHEDESEVDLARSIMLF